MACRGTSGGVLRRLHALGLEATFLPASGETLDGSTRVAASLDVARRIYRPSQAVAGNRPLFVPGDPACYRHALARADRLVAAVAPIGVAPYTWLAVMQFQALPGPGNGAAPWANGNPYVDGEAVILEATAALALYHWGPGLRQTIYGPMDLALHSYVVRWDGATMWPRVDGIDRPSAALAAPAPATVEQTIGAHSATGLFSADVDLYLAAIALRSLSAADLAEVSAITLAGWGV